MFESKKDPYVGMIQGDIYEEDDMIHIDLSNDSVTRRLVEYDQNDLMRYIAQKNPLGSEDLFLSERGSRLGRSVYNAVEEVVEEQEAYIFDEDTWTKAGEDSRQIACEVIFSLREDMNQVFYESAVNSIEEYAFEEATAMKSEI